MEHEQALRRLSKGIERDLTPHEMRRGYVFISNDRSVPRVIDDQYLDVEIARHLYPSRRMGVSGWVHIPRRFSYIAGLAQDLRIEIVSKKKTRFTLLK